MPVSSTRVLGLEKADEALLKDYALSRVSVPAGASSTPSEATLNEAAFLALPESVSENYLSLKIHTQVHASNYT